MAVLVAAYLDAATVGVATPLLDGCRFVPTDAIDIMFKGGIIAHTFRLVVLLWRLGTDFDGDKTVYANRVLRSAIERITGPRADTRVTFEDHCEMVLPSPQPPACPQHCPYQAERRGI